MRAEFAWNCAIRIQKIVRGIAGRKRFALIKFQVHTKMCLRLQRVGRGYLGRRRFRGIRLRMERVLDSIREVRELYILFFFVYIQNICV
jgi:hypothetical protein